MRERVQTCQDPQTEFALIRAGLGDSSVNHIFMVQEHTILEEETAAKTFDEEGLGSLERLYPRFTEDSAEQATLTVGQSGKGCKRSVDVVREAHLGVVIAARP